MCMYICTCIHVHTCIHVCTCITFCPIPCIRAEGNALAIEQTSVATRMLSCGSTTRTELAKAFQRLPNLWQTFLVLFCRGVFPFTFEQDERTEDWWVRRTPRRLPMLPQMFTKPRRQACLLTAAAPGHVHWQRPRSIYPFKPLSLPGPKIMWIESWRRPST